MEVKRLSLSQFRIYEQLDLSFKSGVNLISGSNGQGKTTLLEAIFLCTCARSHKTAKDRELIRHEATSYRVSMDFYADADNVSDGYMENLTLCYSDKDKDISERPGYTRTVWYNGVKLDRIAELMGLFHAVIFAPEDIMLVKEGPQGRRRFIDLLIARVNRPYFLALQRYSKILLYRNKLLKNGREENASGAYNESFNQQIEVWDEQLISAAAAILWQRMKFVEELSDEAEHYHHVISSGKETLRLNYDSLCGLSECQSEDQVHELYARQLKKTIHNDIFRGSTSIGPHRDDMSMLLNGASLKIYGSQGQQRTAVLALKQAELQLLKKYSQQTPVLLLDDVLPELDEARRLSLMNSIGEAQVFITCTDADEVHNKLREMLIERGSANYVVEDSRVTMKI